MLFFYILEEVTYDKECYIFHPILSTLWTEKNIFLLGKNMSRKTCERKHHKTIIKQLTLETGLDLLIINAL